MEQPRWLERLAGATRFRIVELLQRSDRTVQEVADEIGVTSNAVRGHLASLERDGLVARTGVRRDTGGKPAALYGLSPEADEAFPKAYAVVLRALLAALDERMGGDAVAEMLGEIGAHAASRAEGTPRERVEAAADVLRELGGTVEVHRDEGGWRIQGFACPLSAVTREDERVCGLAESLVHTVTGARVREVCSRRPRPRCAFEVEFTE